MNDIWEGPGSLEKVLNAELEMKQSGKDVKLTAADLVSPTRAYDDDGSVPVADAGTSFISKVVNARIAQLVEQGFCKPQVAGSNSCSELHF